MSLGVYIYFFCSIILGYWDTGKQKRSVRVYLVAVFKDRGINRKQEEEERKFERGIIY